MSIFLWRVCSAAAADAASAFSLDSCFDESITASTTATSRRAPSPAARTLPSSFLLARATLCLSAVALVCLAAERQRVARARRKLLGRVLAAGLGALLLVAVVLAVMDSSKQESKEKADAASAAAAEQTRQRKIDKREAKVRNSFYECGRGDGYSYSNTQEGPWLVGVVDPACSKLAVYYEGKKKYAKRPWPAGVSCRDDEGECPTDSLQGLTISQPILAVWSSADGIRGFVRGYHLESGEQRWEFKCPKSDPVLTTNALYFQSSGVVEVNCSEEWANPFAHQTEWELNLTNGTTSMLRSGSAETGYTEY